MTYTSGLITTQASFAQQYGYFEMRARLPAGRGFWPAFWLLPTDLSRPPEIDVVEVLGHEPTMLYVTAHYVEGGKRKTNGVCSADCGKAGIPVTVPDTSRAFHTYGVSWKPDAIRWCFAGVEVFSAPAPAGMHQPLYILANLAVGRPESWPGPADGTSFPTMLIDCIRAHQFDDLAGFRTPARQLVSRALPAIAEAPLDLAGAHPQHRGGTAEAAASNSASRSSIAGPASLNGASCASHRSATGQTNCSLC